MKDRLFDKAKDVHSQDIPTVDIVSGPLQRRRVREVGLLSLTQLGHFYSVESEVSFGRGSEVMVQMPEDAGLSRKHCTVSKGPAGFSLIDHDSRNGTFVNGTRAKEARLQKGDLVRFGSSLLMLEEKPDPSNDPLLVGVSIQLHALRDMLTRLASAPIPVLVIGETGTGKELAAQRLHELSHVQGALVPINAAAIPDTLAESTLFGHVKGAFSGALSDQPGVFEQASNGTLFLDEIGELALPLQAKLLRVLEGGDYSPVGSPIRRKSTARVVAATNADLGDNTKFRADLYARLAGAIVSLAPLRERRIDIPYLMKHFSKDRDVFFTAELIERFMMYAWPMNVRELRQRVQRMLFESPNQARFGVASAGDMDAAPAPVAAAPEPASREDFEETVRRLQGNVVQLAKHYGRTRKQIYRWAERFGLDLTTFR